MGIFCLLYQPKFAALASGELPKTLSQRVERHLDACIHCQQEWSLQQRLVKALRGAAPLPAASSPFLWERLEAAIQSEALLPPVFHARRLAPLGGLALAGAAAAAVLVVYPRVMHTPQATRLTINRVTLAQATPAPAPEVLTALDQARRSDTKIALNKPVSDPFAPRVQRITPVQRVTPPLLQRRKHLPPLTAKDTDTLLPTKINAVAHLELGAVHIQTAEFNREVKEAEALERSSAQRATSTPTDAIASARGEVNLGIFQ